MNVNKITPELLEENHEKIVKRRKERAKLQRKIGIRIRAQELLNK